MKTSSSSREVVPAAALAVGMAVAFLLMLRDVIAHEATPESGSASSALLDRGCGSIEDCRVGHGTIFFGRVVDVLKTGKADEGLPLYFAIYEVDVERTLRSSSAPGREGREATGRVQVKVNGVDLRIEDKGRSAPLVVGERYLFFAGMLRNEGYLVDAEVGFVRVSDDEEAEELAAAYAPLISRSQKEEQAALALATVTARAEPRTPPSAQIEPSHGPAGSEVMINGSGFTPANVLVLWDENNPEVLPEVEVQPDGRFSITLMVPKGLEPGKHTLSVEGAGSDSLELTFVVE